MKAQDMEIRTLWATFLLNSSLRLLFCGCWTFKWSIQVCQGLISYSKQHLHIRWSWKKMTVPTINFTLYKSVCYSQLESTKCAMLYLLISFIFLFHHNPQIISLIKSKKSCTILYYGVWGSSSENYEFLKPGIKTLKKQLDLSREKHSSFYLSGQEHQQAFQDWFPRWHLVTKSPQFY